LQAEKAAFEEAEKKKADEEVLSWSCAA